jgi:hypothetical protein
LPAKAQEQLMKLVEDLELGRIADARLADDQHQTDQIVAAALTCWATSVASCC